MGPGLIRVFPDPGALAAAAARAVAGALRRGVEERGGAVIALAGGSTPVGTYRILARHHQGSVPWGRVHVLLGDERMVPPEHPESNYRMARKELLDHLPVPPESVHRVRTELGSPEAAAAEYEDRIRALFQLGPVEIPTLDLVLLGLGADGHTASLMPGCPAVREKDRLVSWCPPGGRRHARVTLTLPVLNHAREVAFLVAGPGKSGVLRQVLEGGAAGEELPAAAVRPIRGGARWLVDAEAARDLSPGLRERAVAEVADSGPGSMRGPEEPMEEA